MARLPRCVVVPDALPEKPGRYAGARETLSYGKRLGSRAGLRTLEVHLERLPPKHRTSYPHAHKDEEEFVFVLRGRPTLSLGNRRYRLNPGTFVGFPSGTGLAHTFVNETRSTVMLLVGGDRSTGGMIFYPDNPEVFDAVGSHRRWLPHNAGPKRAR